MNSDAESFEDFKELTELASRLLESQLSAEDFARLGELISESREAHATFIEFCDLHSMLAEEPSIREALSAEHRPENVVTLPGSKPVGVESEIRQKARPSRWKVALVAAAAVLAGSLFLSSQFRSSESIADPELAQIEPSDAESRTSEPGPIEEPLIPEILEADPEEQYERAVLASLGSGSQERPPTNFASEPSLADQEISFSRDIRPILSDNCFHCHGPDEHSRAADLRLDTRKGATAGKFPAIVAGDPEASELIARLLSDDPDDIMPPPESHKQLTPDQIALLTRWITEGAEWEGHWAFMPLDTKPEALETESIDGFVDRSLERRQLSRSEEADRRTLIRRATLDLTGLPPTPEEVNAFLDAPGESAYETLIDDLLARPTFGEHRARYWLDAARYADTHGLHLDNYREIWPYRDWVIEAFNDNMPFDQFTIEQIAGDFLPDPTTSQLIATGFNRCNVTTSEGGSIDEEFYVRYAVDRVATTSTVWMGLTTSCAQCHNHKFDPITMEDFYRLYAFFNHTTQEAMDKNIRDTPPVIRVYESDQQEQKAERLRTKLEKLEKEKKPLLNALSFENTKVDEVAPEFLSHQGGEAPTRLGKIANFGKDQPFTVSFRYKLPAREGRVTVAESVDPANRDRGWRVYWEERGFTIELIESYPDKTLRRGYTRRINQGSGGHFGFTYDGSGHSRGIQIYFKGDAQPSRFQLEWLDTLTGDFASPDAELIVGGSSNETEESAKIDEFAILDRALSADEFRALADYSSVKGIERKMPLPVVIENSELASIKGVKKPETRNKEEQEKLHRFLATFGPGPYRNASLEHANLKSELSRIESTTPTTLVMAEIPEGEPMAHLLIRGEYDQKGEEVSPGFPEFLPDFGEEFPLNRLGLAQWLVHPEHPLTARVTVNRIWQELFGVGLVKTSEDFGTQGESPSHPLLLDWLAAHFIESGWDVKGLYRTIMLSNTYRQSSRLEEGMFKRDPENRLLARGPRFRLDAEMIRDQALFASGLLDSTIGGSGVKPYQPSGVWAAVGYTNSNTQTFYQDLGSGAEHRRSIYTFWKRTAHPPNMAIFDAPNREACVMRRERTNTPLQALVLMNDPQYVRAARFLALRVFSESDDQDVRLDRLAELLRSKPLTREERLVVVNSLDQFRNIYESDGEAAALLLQDETNPHFSIPVTDEKKRPELAAWTMVANQILNLDEVISKN
ncbi:MAG: DUF1553 domain-containing protein [Verrucomicrobiota bacterium]